MKTFLMVTLALAFSVSAMACDGSGKSKEKKPETSERSSLTMN